MADTLDRDDGWTVGSPALGRGCARMAFALSLWLLGGIGSVAVDFLHLPRLFGSVVTGRTALLYLAWFCTGCVVLLGALLAGLQRAADHPSSGEVRWQDH